MAQHAILSPSGASRWLTCTKSARFELQFPDTSSDFAAEGTLAHRLGELFIRKRLNLISDDGYEIVMQEILSHKLFKDGKADNAMIDHAEDYAVFVMEKFAEAQAHTSDALIFLEEKIDLTKYIPEGFGTADVIIIADGVLTMIDLKYGKGVLVSAEENRQMMTYALGGLEKFDFAYDISEVEMIIHQPRIANYSSWKATVENLKLWAEEELKPKAALAFAGEGAYVAGSHCRFCRAKAMCKANAEYNLDLAKYEFADPATLEDTEVAEILSKADNFENWIKAVEAHALNAAVNDNKKWPGFKLVEGRSNRAYKDEKEVVEVLTHKYPAEVIYKPAKVNGITELTKALGKKVFDTLIGPLLIKPQGKPALVPASDKRPEYNNAASAADVFADVQID
jgi:hypothetical protein